MKKLHIRELGENKSIGFKWVLIRGKKNQEKLKTYGRVSSYKLKSKLVVISRNIVAKLRVKDF